MPIRGFENVVSRRMKPSLSRSGETAALMACMPNISTAKPSSISPTWWLDCFFENILSTIPITATTAVIVEVEKSDTQPPEPARLERQIIQPVTLVPISAPRMTDIACLTFIIPEFTKPTAMTEVAEDDCITAVTAVPSSTPLSGVPDSL